MNQPKQSPAPSINYLDPNSVPKDWKGTVTIFGAGFDMDTFAFFDAMNPPTAYVSTGRLDVKLGTDITGTPGIKRVKVHDGQGRLSNEVEFVVKR